MGRYRVGDTVHSNNCGVFKILSKTGNDNKRLIQFLSTGCEYRVDISSINKGEVKDYLLPSVFGVGVTGFCTISEDDKPHYLVWVEVLKRCYYERKSQQYHCTTYVDCSMSENFRYFPYFKDWCNNQVGFNSIDEKGVLFHLDKDILVKGNKVYSETTCCFVPQEINGLFTLRKNHRGEQPLGVYFNKALLKYSASLSIKGKSVFLGLHQCEESAFLAYKQAKETYIKEVANKWKEQIDPRVYEALMKYEVEITD